MKRIATLAAVMLLGLLAWADAEQGLPVKESRMKLELTERQQRKLVESLGGMDQQYDEKERLVTRYKGGEYDYNSYLRNTTVHPVLDSLKYAVALLDTGDEQRRTRAEGIVRRVLEFQDIDEKSKSCGVWGKFLEEPLPQAPYVDYNWADFMAVQLLHIAIYHSERLPDDLNRAMGAATLRAAGSIRRRNITVEYTNIAVMGTYVTLVASEVYDETDLHAYAMDRLKRFHDYTVRNGGFAEYNSPTYTMVALQDLARLRLHARTTEARPMIEKVYYMEWAEIAQHYYGPARQWAGPYSRAYGDLAGKDLAPFIERNTKGRLNWGLPGGSDADVIPAPCPEDLVPLFEPLKAPRTIAKTFNIGDAARPEPQIVGTTYLSPAFALGSINLGDLWNQKRVLLAHWGTPEAPAYMRLRFLHDGYDFQAMQFRAAQREGNVLAALCLATDAGDKHPSLDRIKDATVQAKDFRVRWEFGGAGKDTRVLAPAEGADARVEAGGLQIRIAAPFAEFGEMSGRWEAGKDDQTAYLDLVFYAGPERPFKLDELKVAAMVLAVQIAEQAVEMPPVRTSTADGRVSAQWRGMSLSVPLRPGTVKAFKQDATEEQAKGR